MLPELYGQQRGHQGGGGLEVVQEQEDSQRQLNPRRTHHTLGTVAAAAAT